MIIQRTTSGLDIAAPAKVNLFLEVLGRRSDGYHEIQSLLCPISLFDRLVFEVTDQSEIEFQLHLPAAQQELAKQEADPAWDIPSDETTWSSALCGECRKSWELGSVAG